MKRKRIRFLKPNPFFVLMLLILLAGSCKKDISTDGRRDDSIVDPGTSQQLKATSVDLPGRTLAANCFQCHGTNGYAGELKIAGQSSSEIISHLNEMKLKDPRANIMNVHAQAYTTEEIKLIADFISKQ